MRLDALSLSLMLLDALSLWLMILNALSLSLMLSHSWLVVPLTAGAHEGLGFRV
jgi:hypothetical protein